VTTDFQKAGSPKAPRRRPVAILAHARAFAAHWKHVRWSRRLLYVVATIVLALAASEALLRCFLGNNALGQLLVFRPDGPYCVALAPGRSVIHTGLFRRIPPVRQTINRYGYRGPARPPEKAPDVYRVIVVGDSFTFCPGVPDGEDYPAWLERHLSRSGRRVEVLNFGVLAHNLAEDEAHVESDAVAYHPDMVIVQVTGNDFCPSVCTLLAKREWLLRLTPYLYVARIVADLEYLAGQTRYDLSCEDRQRRFGEFVHRLAATAARSKFAARVVAFGDPVACAGGFTNHVLHDAGIPYLPFPREVAHHNTLDSGHLDREGADLYAKVLARWIRVGEPAFGGSSLERSRYALPAEPSVPN
jgi:lysophospholipase L1-like esterase